MKRALLNLPLVVALLLTTAFSADLPVLRAWKTEATFGLWVVVLVPLAVVLLVTQLVLWLACPASRWKHQPATREGSSPTTPPRARPPAPTHRARP